MKVIGIDLGGTKIAAAVVNEKGKILRELKEPTNLSGGWPKLKSQILTICRELMKEKGIKAVGVGSAGPLHAPSGKLLDPTNFGWKGTLTVPLASDLQKSLKIPVTLENDAAAASLAEEWKGKSGKNSVVLTLGTGLGIGVIADGRLVRGGRGLHPEGGHLLLRPGDKSALCGCGNFGCAEAFLSGKNFSARCAQKLHRPGLTGEELSQLAREKDPKALALFEEYAELLAEYLHNIVVLYYPEKVVLTGSFAEAAPFFLPSAEEKLKVLLSRRLKTLPLLPKIQQSKLGNKAGILGAAHIALWKDYASR